MRSIAESASKMEPRREKENGEPGRKEEERVPTIRSEGCSRSCCVAVRDDLWARSFFISLSLEGAAADDNDDVLAAGLGVDELEAARGADEEDFLELLDVFFFGSAAAAALSASESLSTSL